MDHPKFQRAAARRRVLAFLLAVLFHLLLLAGLAWLGTDGAAPLDEPADAVEVKANTP